MENKLNIKQRNVGCELLLQIILLLLILAEPHFELLDFSYAETLTTPHAEPHAGLHAGLPNYF